MPDDDQRLTTDDFSSSPPREGERDRTGEARETTGEQERGRETTGEQERGRETTGEQDPGRDSSGDGDRGTTATAPPEGRAEREEPLLPPSDLEDLRQRWDSVQTQFVDEPRQAVEQADELVAEVMRKLADTFSSERSSLEEQWERAGEADTETLRVTLQRYRSFFDRLLSA